jgi:hypothetical protein
MQIEERVVGDIVVLAVTGEIGLDRVAMSRCETRFAASCTRGGVTC